MRKTAPRGVARPGWAATLLLVTCATFAPATASDVYMDDFPGDPTRGRFVMEAEHYGARMQDAGGGWWRVDGSSHLFVDGPQANQPVPNAVPGPRGDYMESLAPGNGAIAPIDSNYHASVMEYRFDLEAPGDYRLYARWRGDGPHTDSIYASIWKPDGTLLTGAGPLWFTFHQWRSGWIWDNRGIKDSTFVSGVGFPHQAKWTIADPGIYTLRISQREAESALDAMVLQTVGLAAPSGLGPPESQLAGETVEVAIDIRPATCDNRLNVVSLGRLGVLLLGSEDLDVSRVDPGSVRLDGVAPSRAARRDMGTPVFADDGCPCGIASPDGHDDLILFFPAEDLVVSLVARLGGLVPQETFALTLTARLDDGTRVEGRDCVRIRGRALAVCAG